MICVEIPVRTIEDEMGKLTLAEGYHSELYAQGARDALNWLLKGGDAPSEGKGFPMLKKAA
jgi:hypothetical protein